MRILPVLIATLALAGAAAAQINHPYNEVGIYTVEQPDGCATARVEVPVGGEFWCYLVLTNPWNEALDRPVTTVGGFEFRLGIPEGVIVLASVYPPFHIDDCFGCWPDFRVGANMPVNNGFRTLMPFQIMVTTGEPVFLSMAPTAVTPSSIPGEIVFTDYDDDFSLQVMHPVSGSFDVPVFAINWDGDLSFCQTVPLRDESFGSLKALYR
ncbi:MAG: hypothetical protein R6X35_02340 [Candidatus Krumholzibacteriia bacterium]